MIKKYTLLALILLAGTMKLAQAQNKPGTWTPYLAFSNAFKTEVTPGKTYFATQGGLFFFNHSDNSIGTLTKNEGLSETRVSTMGYNEVSAQLVIVYENGSIDLLSQDGKIFPIIDLKRKNIAGNKTVNRLYQKGNLCYLACGFGIVALDVSRREVKDTYIIGPQGSYLNVNSVTSDEQSIYAATSNGLMMAPLTSNLLDFRNWNLVNDPNLPVAEYLLTYNHEGTLYAVQKKEGSDYGDKVFRKKANDVWSRAWWPVYAYYEMRFMGNNMVLIASDYEVNLLSIATEQKERLENYPFLMPEMSASPKSVAIDPQGRIWIADQNYGAIRYENQQYTLIEAAGPKHNGIFHLSFNEGMLWVSRGGVNKAWGNTYQSPLLQHFNGQDWSYFDRTNTPELLKMSDIICSAPVPGEKEHVFVSPYGEGIIEFDNGDFYKHYNHLNSTLMRVPLSDPSVNIVRVGGLAHDQEGNLWMSNALVDKNLHCLKADGTWKSFYLPEIANNYDVGKVIVSSNNLVWMVVPRGKTYGLYVMDTDGVQKKHLDVVSYFMSSTTPRIQSMNDVYDIAEDLEGHIWVGTSKGVIVYNDPSRVFEQDPYYGYQPAVDQNDGIYHPLLETEIVTAIAVDGANQKWLGTVGSGLYLVSSDGTKELLHFTDENSPLLNNSITSLAYDGENGILYIGTETGLIAYHTESRIAREAFSDVYAYPNPVRPAYKGNIYIKGLMYNTNVKITTVSGRLVYETVSQGGQAVWPGTDLAGNRVFSGVYLVFCASEDGQQSEVTKILFIR